MRILLEGTWEYLVTNYEDGWYSLFWLGWVRVGYIVELFGEDPYSVWTHRPYCASYSTLVDLLALATICTACLGCRATFAAKVQPFHTVFLASSVVLVNLFGLYVRFMSSDDVMGTL